MPLQRPDNRLYLGMGGSGKTWLALRHAAAFDRIVYVRPSDSERAPWPETRDRAALCVALKQARFAVTFTTDADPELWEWANRAALAAGDCLVVWEEASSLGDGKPKLPTYAHALWMRGRHEGCRVFACSQRPSRISRDCTANLSRAVIFATTEPNDLKFYRDMIGDRAAIDRIRSLARYEAVDFDPLHGWNVKKSPFE
jgi:pimeloyl-ACP methyl ester carboxylesterase